PRVTPAVEIARNPVEPDPFAEGHGSRQCSLDEAQVSLEVGQRACTDRMIEVRCDLEVLGLVCDLGDLLAADQRERADDEQQGCARSVHAWACSRGRAPRTRSGRSTIRAGPIAGSTSIRVRATSL